MALTDSEIHALRFHLGYGNVDVGAYPYTPDNFQYLFESVIAPNLETVASTTASTSTTAGASTTVTVGSLTSIAAWTQLIVDVGDDAEIVVARSTSGSTFTAYFTKAHTQPYPVAVSSGESRLRYLLWQADKAWQTLQSSTITGSAGLRQLGKGEIEWFPGGALLADTTAHYESIADSISALVRVRRLSHKRRSGGALEVY
jgi:hypothetical protein